MCSASYCKMGNVGECNTSYYKMEELGEREGGIMQSKKLRSTGVYL